jgi:hypothetical protein
MKKHINLRASIALGLIFAFLANCLGPLVNNAKAGELNLPDPGAMVNLSPAYVPVLIKGLRAHPDNPLLFDFMLDTGNSGLKVDSLAFKAESEKLIKYFLASLTIKEDDLWVNLSPYEKDRIIPQELGQTELGRDMLAQDYILKQLTASLIYPERKLGKEFWSRIYAKAREMYGTSEVPVNTFNKVWIVADKAKVLESNNAAYVIGAHLKVMLEDDYLAVSKHQGQDHPHALTNPIIRQIILPELEKEVNRGQNFAALRQMFYSMILASWYKQALKDALLNQVYSNKGKIGGVLSDDLSVKEKIYQRYLKAYKKGVFNYIKEDIRHSGDGDERSVSISRKYFSGGEVFPVLRKIDRVHTAPPEEIAGMISGDLAMAAVDMTKSPGSSMQVWAASRDLEDLRRANGFLDKTLPAIVENIKVDKEKYRDFPVQRYLEGELSPEQAALLISDELSIVAFQRALDWAWLMARDPFVDESGYERFKVHAHLLDEGEQAHYKSKEGDLLSKIDIEGKKLPHDMDMPGIIKADKLHQVADYLINLNNRTKTLDKIFKEKQKDMPDAVVIEELESSLKSLTSLMTPRDNSLETYSPGFCIIDKNLIPSEKMRSVTGILKQFFRNQDYETLRKLRFSAETGIIIPAAALASKIVQLAGDDGIMDQQSAIIIKNSIQLSSKDRQNSGGVILVDPSYVDISLEDLKKLDSDPKAAASLGLDPTEVRRALSAPSMAMRAYIVIDRTLVPQEKMEFVSAKLKWFYGLKLFLILKRLKLSAENGKIDKEIERESKIVGLLKDNGAMDQQAAVIIKNSIQAAEDKEPADSGIKIIDPVYKPIAMEELKRLVLEPFSTLRWIAMGKNRASEWKLGKLKYAAQHKTQAADKFVLADGIAMGLLGQDGMVKDDKVAALVDASTEYTIDGLAKFIEPAPFDFNTFQVHDALTSGNSAMLTVKRSFHAPGGIDLNARNLDLNIIKDGRGVEVKFSPIIAAELQGGDFSGIVPVIIRITPITSPLPVLGIKP